MSTAYREQFVNTNVNADFKRSRGVSECLQLTQRTFRSTEFFKAKGYPSYFMRQKKAVEANMGQEPMTRSFPNYKYEAGRLQQVLLQTAYKRQILGVRYEKGQGSANQCVLAARLAKLCCRNNYADLEKQSVISLPGCFSSR